MANSPVSDVGTSMIRTVVPIVVGLIVALAAKAGFNVTSASITPVVASGAAAVYYVAVRMLELRWPRLGLLLGSATQPVYVPSSAPKAAGVK